MNYGERKTDPLFLCKNCGEYICEGESFLELEEGRLWALQPGGRYYLTRNGSSLIAFWLPAQAPASWRMSAAHSDSPTFRVKKTQGRSLAGWQRLAALKLRFSGS